VTKRRLPRVGRALVVAGVLCSITAPAARADHGLPRGATASLSGRVEDRAGVPLVGVALVLLGPDVSPMQRTLHTDRHGGYRVVELAPGRYRLRVRYRDQPEQERELSLAAGESQRLDVRLPATAAKGR
jgi:hypothetical protein